MNRSDRRSRRIRERYDRNAPLYSLFERIVFGLLGVHHLRRRLLARCRGEVLEVAAGTGGNLPHYPKSCGVTLADFSREMLSRAVARRDYDRVGARAVAADSRALPFRGDRFDTVVSTFSLCTVVDPVEALREMARVTRPGGRLLLMEHGLSRHRWLNRLFHRLDRPWSRFAMGCHLVRDPERMVIDAGLQLVSSRRLFVGAVYQIAVSPGGSVRR